MDNFDWKLCPFHDLFRAIGSNTKVNLQRSWSDEVLLAAGHQIQKPLIDSLTTVIRDEKGKPCGLAAQCDIPKHQVIGLYPIHYALNTTTGMMYDMIHQDVYAAHEIEIFKQASRTDERGQSIMQDLHRDAKLKKRFENYMATQRHLDSGQDQRLPPRVVLTKYRPDFQGIAIKDYTNKVYQGHLPRLAIMDDEIVSVVKDFYEDHGPVDIDLYHQIFEKLKSIMEKRMNAVPVMFPDANPMMLLITTRDIAEGEEIFNYMSIDQAIATANMQLYEMIAKLQSSNVAGSDIVSRLGRELIQPILETFQSELVHLEKRFRPQASQ